MEPGDIVSQICDDADTFLAGVTRPAEARAGIEEWLTIHHARLAPADRKATVDRAMRILESEGFFQRDAGSEA
ncbi:MAG TPA: hypothetical protein VL200_16315 [Lacunisphaera sp.]|nr:hypothetical protein [Lacunisphaera sp.]